MALLLLLGITLLLPAQGERVLFSTPGGFYDHPFQITLACLYPNHHVRYTTNGNLPTATSDRYEAPLTLDEHLFSSSNIHTIPITPEGQMFYPETVEQCIVIRAAVFDEDDNCISPAVTNSYFIPSLGNDSHGLPVVSICADSLDLFSYDYGILVPGAHFDPSNPQWTGNYYQTGRDWERTVNVEFYEPDNTGINQVAGMRTHGGNGRRFQQKSLKIYAREEYGKKRFKHPFFESIPNNSFKHLVLKPFSSSWTPAGLEDHLCTAIARPLQVETLASRPVVLFLNGTYWGLYYIHEKADERFLEDHFDVDLDDCDIAGNWHHMSEYGNADDLFATLDRLEYADLTDPIEYQRLEQAIDLESFIDYQILELFLANTDWPSNNMRCWREGNGRWRWIFYDGDACLNNSDFDVFANATYIGSASWPSCSRATLLFRRLMANASFREQFQHRCLELLDTHLQYLSTREPLIETQQRIQQEIPSQSQRFNIPESLSAWEGRCQAIDKFLQRRPDQLKERLEHYLQSAPWVWEEWTCYVTPSTGQLSIRFHTDRSAVYPLAVYDVAGHCLYHEMKAIPSGYNAFSLDLQVSPGVYILVFGPQSKSFCVF